jgi:hypothetical protein
VRKGSETIKAKVIHLNSLPENIKKVFKHLNKNNSRLTFDIQKLVDDRIIFVTEPGDGQGGVAKPNWEGDCSVITLPNLTDEQLKLNPWRKEAINRPFIECIPYVQDRQSDWSEEKYQQVIDSIETKGGKIDNYTI